MSRVVETAFLPAALEIERTPPSPVGRAILWLILAFFTAAVAWACLGRVDIVAVAHGRVIPSGHSKTVQPLEIGTVAAIHVKEGQAVDAGQSLIELDATGARADVDRFTADRETAARDVARFEALTAWLGNASAPAGSGPAMSDPLLQMLWREHRDRLGVLAHERERQLAERRKARRQADKLQAILPIVGERANDAKSLAAQKLLSEQHYLDAEKQRLETYHDLRALQAGVAELDAAVSELDARIAYAESEFHRQVLERLDDARRRLAAAGQALTKAAARASARTVRAPVAGVLQQLAIHNTGAIVTPAQELAVIVPRRETLEIEAVLENKDIGFVAVGQRAEIKVDGFPFTRYGTLAGEIVGLSSDAVPDEQKGLVYKMRVRMARAHMQVNGQDVALSPGMTVTVEARTGSRRMIDFFLAPLLRFRDESIRER